MPSLYKLFKTDEKSEQEGITVEYMVEADQPPVRIRIARAGGSNSRYARVFEAKVKPYRRQLAAGTLDEQTSRRLYAEVYADSVVLGWENLTDDKDQPIPFNRENCVKILMDLPELADELRTQATRIAPFRAEVNQESDTGN